MNTEINDPEFVAKLRLAVNPPGKKANCLNNLTDSQLVEVYHMLRSNSKQWNFKAIARHIVNNWAEIGDVDWVADTVSYFSDQVLGPRRGLAKMKGPASPDEVRLRDRMRKREEKAKKQISEIVELGTEIVRLQDMIDYWDGRGRERGEPYNEIARYEALIVEMAKSRHQMKVAEGLARPTQQQLDGSVRETFTLIRERISDPKNYSSFLSSYNKRLEELAEPIDVDKLVHEDAHEMELLPEDDQGGDSSIDPERYGSRDEPDSGGADNN